MKVLIQKYQIQMVAVIICLFTNINRSYSYDAVIENPEATLKAVFPGMDSYEVLETSINLKEDEKNRSYIRRYAPIQVRGSLKNIGINDPVTIYYIKKNQSLLGYVLGSNATLNKEVIQIFTAIDNEDRISDIFVQKISNKNLMTGFNSKIYRKQFRRFSMAYPLDEAYITPPENSIDKDALMTHATILKAIRWNIVLAKVIIKKSPESLSIVGQYD